MTSINGVIIQDDDIENILSRYASENDTLRKYLYVEKDFQKGKDNTIVDFLKIIKESEPSYTSFYEKNQKIISSLIEKNKLNLVDDIIKFWVAYSDIFNDELLQYTIPLVSEEINTTHGKSIVTDDDLTNFYNNRFLAVRELNDKIYEIKKRYEKRSESKVDFASIPTKEFSDIDIQNISMTFTLKVSDLSLSELFNDMILNIKIPFVYYKNFFKILKNFKVDETWYQESENDQIVLYVKDKVSEESYTNVSIDEKFKVSFDLTTKKGYVSSNEFIENILKILNLSKASIENITEEKISSFYVYKNVRLNSYIFADLAMNEKLFSSFISIDESTKATKKQTSSGERWIYIHFNDETTGHITAGITQRAPDEQYSQPYLKINCKGKDRNKVEKFQTIFGKLLSLYGIEKDSIIKQYGEYIDNFAAEQAMERKISRKTMIKATQAKDVIDPNQIVGFSRQCQQHNNLVKIDEKEYEKLASKNAIEFPRNTGIGNVVYPSDGKNMSYYKCVDSDNKYIFPGVQVNNTGNFQDYFPYLPCCFKKDQTNRDVFKHYYGGEELKTSKGKQQELIKTEKILAYDNFGELPDNLISLFKIIDPESQYSYHRFGMDRSTGSFISCILTAILDKNYTKTFKHNDDKKLLNERKKQISALRNIEFTSETILPLCKQCAYDIDDANLKNIIKNDNIYFDPKMFIQMIQEYFNLNVILFDKEGVLKPYYSQKYYHNFKPSKPYIFVYENWGSERDRAEYPQCELIIRWKKNENETLYTFDEGDYVCQNVRNIFSDLIQSYIISNKNQTIQYNENYFSKKSINVKSQTIDSYGKTRQLNIEYENKNITLFTSPIQPLKVVTNNNLIYKTSTDIAETIFKKLGMNTIYRDKESIQGSNGSDIFTILLGDVIVEKTPSKLSLYNENKKVARYLSEYILWHFSNYLDENKIDSIDDDTINNFSNDMIIIQNDYKYNNILKTFSKKSPVFDDDGKLIVTSEEMLKRLIYLLRLRLKQNYTQITKYNKNTVIPNYYIDLTDYDTHPNQTILQGGDCIYKWNSSLSNKVYIYDTVIPKIKQAYFFKNNNIDNNTYLAQNTHNIDNAIKISVIWNTKGYNIGYYAEADISTNYSYILYSFGDQNDISVYEIQGEKSFKPIRIIGYKIDEVANFTILLEN
jgi:hypothetical protein